MENMAFLAIFIQRLPEYFMKQFYTSPAGSYPPEGGMNVFPGYIQIKLKNAKKAKIANFSRTFYLQINPGLRFSLKACHHRVVTGNPSGLLRLKNLNIGNV